VQPERSEVRLRGSAVCETLGTVANISRFRTVFTGVAGTPWYSNMYFEGGTPEGAAYGPMVNSFWVAISSAIRNSVSWSVEPTYVVIESGTGAIQDIGDWEGAVGAGGSGVEALPWATQGLIHWHTSVYVSGRELRGRTFVPGLAEGANAEGVVSGAVQDQMQAAADGLIDDSSHAFTIYSPTHHVEHVVQSGAASGQFAVLRSRRD